MIMANERNRPALVTFAGIMMIMVGMFNLTSAIAGLTNASWLEQFKNSCSDREIQLETLFEDTFKGLDS